MNDANVQEIHQQPIQPKLKARNEWLTYFFLFCFSTVFNKYSAFEISLILIFPLLSFLMTQKCKWSIVRKRHL